MSQEKSFVYLIPSSWEMINNIRKKVEKVLEELPVPYLAAQAVVVSSELLENGIKYGKPPVKFLFGVMPDRVLFQISHRIVSATDVQKVKEHIHTIHSSKDPSTLYLDRVLEFTKPELRLRRPSLGLYRIAVEGQFNLDCNERGEILTITAEKSFTHKELRHAQKS